jgi:hypothetical protein
MKIGLGQCFIDPGLIRTKRTAPLEDVGDALERRTWPSSSRSYRRLYVRAAELRTRRLSSIGDFSGEIGPIAGASRE